MLDTGLEGVERNWLGNLLSENNFSKEQKFLNKLTAMGSTTTNSPTQLESLHMTPIAVIVK